MWLCTYSSEPMNQYGYEKSLGRSYMRFGGRGLGGKGLLAMKIELLCAFHVQLFLGLIHDLRSIRGSGR